MTTRLMITVVLLFQIGGFTKSAAATENFSLAHEIEDILQDTCYDCHDDSVQKGDVRLDNLHELSLDGRLAILNKLQEQIRFQQMPPKDKDQLAPVNSQIILRWVADELSKHNASTLEDKLRTFKYGNHIDHDKLFSGEYADLKGYTPDRQWLISEFIFNAKVNELTQAQSPLGSLTDSKLGVTNPFLLPKISGVRYYANTNLTGEHLLTMLSNAKKIASHMTETLGRKQTYLPAFYELMKMEYEHEKIVATRERFLSSFMERILEDSYDAETHQALLPTFTSTIPEVQKKYPDPSEVDRKNLLPNKKQSPVITRAMILCSESSQTDEELILECEKYWFRHGVIDREIRSFVKITSLNLEGLRKHQKRYNLLARYKPPTYKPLSDGEMAIVKATIMAERKAGDTYLAIRQKCVERWRQGFKQDRIRAKKDNTELLTHMVDESFQKLYGRAPSDSEAPEYLGILQSQINNFGNLEGAQKFLQTLILRSDFVYRNESGSGKADEHGRKMLSPNDAKYALAYALTDQAPDSALSQAAASGKLKTREDYKREVTRMLKRKRPVIVDTALTGSTTDLPIRKIRFFREFFGYPKAMTIFKDNKRLGGAHNRSIGRLIVETDMWVENILKKDQRVIETLLSTEEFIVFHSGNNAAVKDNVERFRKLHLYFKDKPWEDFSYDDYLAHKPFLESIGMGELDQTQDAKKEKTVGRFRAAMRDLAARYSGSAKHIAPYRSWHSFNNPSLYVDLGKGISNSDTVHVAKYFGLPLTEWDYPAEQPAKLANRKGMLTHPAWLMAHAQNTETDPVIRGKWIREKLLAGTIPDIPITVDAVVPEDHHKTFRTRLELATEKTYCWRCHELMNPLGYAFEAYDDFGRFRTEEALEHPDNLIKKGPVKTRPYGDIRDVYKTLPVRTDGHLVGTGDRSLDGAVRDAIDLTDRLARSDRVRQSVIRHAFRYFLGRNETYTDSKTLIDADRAYLDSGGSFDAVIVSLLASDSFIYRKPIPLSYKPN